MKWPFLRLGKSPSDTSDGKKSRLRYKRTRLLDLLCTIKSRKLPRDSPSTSMSGFTDICSSQEGSLPVDLSPVDSLSDLWRSHSLALRRPIPVRSTLILRNQDFMDSSTPKFYDHQPTFCPTCHNMIIPLPQKRRSSHEASQPHAKRVRSCFTSNRSVLLLHGEADIGSINKRGTIGYFNPTYESVNAEIDDSVVYSTIASDSASDCSSSTQSKRQKAFGRRRLTKYDGVNMAELGPWLGNDSTSVDQIYAVIDPDASDNSPVSHDEHAFVLGGPLMCSTLQRGRKYEWYDDETVYDEVASSDIESDSVPAPPSKKARTKRRRESAEKPDDAVKRVRREYFVCEE